MWCANQHFTYWLTCRRLPCTTGRVWWTTSENTGPPGVAFIQQTDQRVCWQGVVSVSKQFLPAQRAVISLASCSHCSRSADDRTWWFFNLMLILGMGLLYFPGSGFTGHCDQGWCAFKPDVVSEILRVHDSGWAQAGALTWRGGWLHYWWGPRWVVLHLGIL